MEIISSTGTTASGNHKRKSTRRASTNSSSTGTSVASGSVWESRMKIDEVKGGIKVFNGATEDFCEGSDHNATNQQQLQRATFPTSTSRRKRLPPLGTGIVGIGKTKTWKAENSDHRNPNQITKDKSEMQRNSADDNNDGDQKSSIQVKKTRSNSTSMAAMSPNLKKTRSDSGRSSKSNAQSTIAGRLRKSKSEPNRGINNNMDESRGPVDSSSQDMGSERNVAFQLTKVKSETDNSSPQTSKISPEISQNTAIGDCDSGIVDNEEEEKETADAGGSTAEYEALKETANGSDNEGCKEFGVCQEELTSVGSIDIGQVEPAVKLEEEEEEEEDDDDDDDDDDDPDGDDVEFVDDEEEDDEEVDEEIVADQANNFDDVIEMNGELEMKDKNALNDVNKSTISQVNNNVNANSSSPSPIITGKLLLSPNKQTLNAHNFSKPRPRSTPSSVIDESQGVTAETHGKLQSLVDLVMWRDVSRSAFVFGLGTFMIISSSYTKDLNISSISVMSYLSLIYLGLIFLYRSILCRGITENASHSGQHNVLGEEEAIWIIRLILPYLNEFLLKLRDLFSGDPAMTMKLAVVLFVLARCGSFFTIWKMVKLGFFGVFTVPKVCSSYSSYLKAHGTFWIRRFQDAWESCSHKKAVAFAIFTLVWNLSSVVARVWAAFMLFVAFRYYQQHYMIKDEQWVHTDGLDDGGRGAGGRGGGTAKGAAAPTHNQARARQVGVRQVGQWRTGAAASADLRKSKKCA